MQRAIHKQLFEALDVVKYTDLSYPAWRFVYLRE